MTAKSRAVLNSDADTLLADNETGDISAADARQRIKDLADSALIKGDEVPVSVANGGTGSGTAAGAATNLGLGTGDSPQLAAVNIGHATDTTLARVSAGNLSVEGNLIYRVGGADVLIADGGTAASTAADARTNLGAAPIASPTFTGTVTMPATEFGATQAQWGTFSATGATAGQRSGPSGAPHRHDSSAVVTTSANHHQFFNPNGQVGSISTNDSATSYNTTSDVALKDFVVDAPLVDIATKVKAVRSVEFEWKTESGVKHLGFLAQEMADVFPDAVTPPSEPGEPWMMDYSKLVPVLWAVVQHLVARVEVLESA